MSDEPPETLLLGALSLDRYVPDGPVLPGGGALNVAWHWRSLGVPFRLVSRVGDGEADMFIDMLERHGIDHFPGSIVAAGPSASIDIEFLPDRQPWMDHYVQGVCGDLRFTSEEELALAGARHIHAILVEGVIAELARLGWAGRLDHLEVVADFLGFRHYTVERFADTMRWVDVAIRRLARLAGRSRSRRPSRRRHRPRQAARRHVRGTGRPGRRRDGRGSIVVDPGDPGAGRRDDGRLRRRVHRVLPRGVVALRRPRGGRRARQGGWRIADCVVRSLPDEAYDAALLQGDS